MSLEDAADAADRRKFKRCPVCLLDPETVGEIQRIHDTKGYGGTILSRALKSEHDLDIPASAIQNHLTRCR